MRLVKEKIMNHIQNQQRLNNPCIKIPFSEIIEWRDDTLQVRWFSDFVGNRVVPC